MPRLGETDVSDGDCLFVGFCWLQLLLEKATISWICCQDWVIGTDLFVCLRSCSGSSGSLRAAEVVLGLSRAVLKRREIVLLARTMLEKRYYHFVGEDLVNMVALTARADGISNCSDSYFRGERKTHHCTNSHRSHDLIVTKKRRLNAMSLDATE